MEIVGPGLPRKDELRLFVRVFRLSAIVGAKAGLGEDGQPVDVLDCSRRRVDRLFGLAIAIRYGSPSLPLCVACRSLSFLKPRPARSYSRW